MDAATIIAVGSAVVASVGTVATLIFNMRRDRRENTIDRSKECDQFHAPLRAAHDDLKQRLNGIVIDKEAAHRVLHERVNGLEKELGAIKLLLTEVSINLKHMMEQAKLTYHEIIKEH